MQTYRHSTSSLFDSQLFGDSLLPWLPDETFFSLCSRHHRMWGYASSGRTAETLFGKRHAGTQHDLPSALETFSLRTHGYLGHASDIAREKTLLRFYRPFLPAADVNDAVQTMRSQSVANLKYQLGLLTSRFRANHPLKACATCMHEDVETYGWAYWHLTHQYPGVWVCPRHSQLLLSSTHKSTGVERFLWHLPATDALTTERSSLTNDARQALDKLSRFIIELVESCKYDGFLHHTSLQTTFRERLRRNNWLTHGGNVRLNCLASSYAEYCAILHSINEFSALPANSEHAAAYVGRLLRPLRSGTHPLNLLTIIDWLFEDEADFLNHHQTKTTSSSILYLTSSSQTDSASAEDDVRRAELVDFIHAGKSITAAARLLRIDISTAMAWVTDAGILVTRRPKTLTPDVRNSLIRALRTGEKKKIIVARYSVSIPSVNRLLRTEPGLQKEWNDAHTANKQQTARQEWTELIRQHASLGVKLIRAMNPAVYAWLYRNDHSWLIAHTPGRLPQSAESRSSSVRWDDRDRALNQAVLQAADSLSKQTALGTLKLWHLYQAVPELKAKLSSLDRLPMTKRTLETLLNRKKPATLSAFLFD